MVISFVYDWSVLYSVVFLLNSGGMDRNPSGILSIPPESVEEWKVLINHWILMVLFKLTEWWEWTKLQWWLNLLFPILENTFSPGLSGHGGVYNTLPIDAYCQCDYAGEVAGSYQLLPSWWLGPQRGGCESDLMHHETPHTPPPLASPRAGTSRNCKWCHALLIAGERM